MSGGRGVRRLGAYGGVVILCCALAAGPLSGQASGSGALTASTPLLWDISCPSTALCVAIDDKGHAVSSTDPTAATPTWSGSATGLLNPQAISCPSTALCVAVDDNGHVAISTNPASGQPTWSAAPIGAAHSFNDGISCASASLCAAVNYEGDAVISTDPTVATPTWIATSIVAIPPTSNFDERLRLSDIACPSTSLCVAVDNKGEVITSTDPADAHPSWRAPIVVDSAALLSISCPSSSLCVAVDSAGRPVVSTDPGDAKPAWHSPGSIDGASLDDISCPSTSLCVAVDHSGHPVISTDPADAMPVWRGGAALGLAGIESPIAVSCASTTFCAAIGIEAASISTNPAAASPTWSAPATIDTVPAGTLSLLGTPTIGGKTLTFELDCSGGQEVLVERFGIFGDGALQECPAQATLTATERLSANGRRVIGVAPSARTRHRRAVVLGGSTITLYDGGVHTATVTIKLNSIGTRLLARFKRLPATLSVAGVIPELRLPARTAVVKTARVTFKAKRPSRHRPRAHRRDG